MSAVDNLATAIQDTTVKLIIVVGLLVAIFIIVRITELGFLYSMFSHIKGWKGFRRGLE